MRKIIFLSLFVLFSIQTAWANMASPVEEGTLSGLPFTSQYVSILHETIWMEPNFEFEQCRFEITYFIDASMAGFQIPFLFVAENYQNGMEVMVDGQVAVLTNAESQDPTAYQRDFLPFFHVFSEDADGYRTVSVKFDSSEGREYRLNDLHYFTADLSKGTHEIKVAYTAEIWKDRSDLVLKKDFRYLLSPARYWKSFGKLRIVLSRTYCKKDIETNLGPPKANIEMPEADVWEFDSLPTDMLTLSLKENVSQSARTLIKIGREGFMWMSAAIFGLLHLGLMWWHRKRKPKKRFSWIWLLGSLFVPAIAILFYLHSIEWINTALGELASKRSDYSFLIIFLYPFAFIAYGLFSFLIDFALRKIYPAKT